MNLNDYQTEAHDYAAYGDNFLYPFLGLAGETGEVCERVKKMIRANPEMEFRDVFDRIGLASELGDVLWYVSEIASRLGLTLDFVAEKNLTELSGRREEGTITSADRDE